MPSFTNIIAASAFLAATVSASPIQLTARDTCGAAPAGPGSQAPLAQPTGITTAALCQAQCEANNSCQSFVFGMVNNVVDCILYSVPAANVPPQSSVNLVVFDKACTSVPAVVPTVANPTGAKLHKRDMCGSAPTGTGSQEPLSQPTGITTAELCLAQCDSLASCLSFLFGLVNGVDECQLFSIAASAIPAQSSPNLVAYDKACSSVPNVVPTTSNPTGAATGSNSGDANTPTQGTHPPNRSVTPVVAHLPALLETPAQSPPQRTLTASLRVKLNARLILLVNRKLPSSYAFQRLY
jgi:hypothetical protein